MRVIQRHKKNSFILLGILFLTACSTATHVPSYDGDLRAFDQVAMIFTDLVGDNRTYKLAIHRVDGNVFIFKSIGAIRSTEVLPGKHTFDIDLNTAFHGRFSTRLWLNAEAGKSYIIKAQVQEGPNQDNPIRNSTASIWFEEKGTNKRVGGIFIK